MDGKIELAGMEFHAYHGCLPEERERGNTFVVDLSFRYDFEKAAREDSLADAVNYGAVYDVVAEQMAQPSKLLENVVWRIREAVSKAFPQISDLHVKVSKANPPVSGPVRWSSAQL